MNNRIEIKIAILGEEGSGKEMFAKMLFLENNSKIRVDPLSKLSEMYLEIDMINFQNTSKKIMEECKQHNNLIMQQNEIKEVANLRNTNIPPLFYKHTQRIRDLIDYSKKNNRINKNILLTFYSIGNNFNDFDEEINNANILIYLVDVNKQFDTNSKLFQKISQIIIQSNNKKYLLTVVNKCDTLNQNGEFDPLTNGHKIISSIDQLIQENMSKENLYQNSFHCAPIAISCKYAHIYRRIQHTELTDISPEAKTFISNMFGIKKENIFKDIEKNHHKYLKRSGYVCFKNILSDILNQNYKSMIDYNFDVQLGKIQQLSETCQDDFILSEHNEEISTNNLFITELQSIREKANRLQKIFKQDYHQVITELLKKILDGVFKSDNPQLSVVDRIKEIYVDNKVIINQIDSIQEQIRLKVVQNIYKKLYATELLELPEEIEQNEQNEQNERSDQISEFEQINGFEEIDSSYQNNQFEEIFLPSKVHILFDKLYNAYLSREELTKLTSHICELYSTKAKILLKTDSNLELLYRSYFTDDESLKIMSMLNEIMVVRNFDTFKIELIQIMITKLMIAEKIIDRKDYFPKISVEKIITYCKSLRHFLSDNVYKKYDYLFNNISDVCTNIIFKMNSSLQSSYISNNINFILNYKPDKIIVLDKFIIKIIKKTNYNATIATDANDSNQDSDIDIDIYENEPTNSEDGSDDGTDNNNGDDGDLSNDETDPIHSKCNFDFTKDDLESDNDNIRQQNSDRLSTKKSNKKSNHIEV